VADIAGAVLVCGAARASSDAVHVLVALGRVLGEVDPGAKHASDVGVPLVEALVDDGVDEGGACGREGVSHIGPKGNSGGHETEPRKQQKEAEESSSVW